MGIRIAKERQRPRIGGGECMFPGQRTSGRYPETFTPQLSKDALSVGPAGDRPVSSELPLRDRGPAAWILSAIEPRWGYARNQNWDGAPLTFYPPKAVDPHVHSGYNPFVHYPTISRGHPVPYGNTIPVLGE